MISRGLGDLVRIFTLQFFFEMDPNYPEDFLREVYSKESIVSLVQESVPTPQSVADEEDVEEEECPSLSTHSEAKPTEMQILNGVEGLLARTIYAGTEPNEYPEDA